MREALAAWAAAEARRREELVALGIFGSYARGDAAVGSDLDLVAIVAGSDLPFERRGASWALEGLPVPAEILVYTRREWEELQRRGGRFAEALRCETVWLVAPDA